MNDGKQVALSVWHSKVFLVIVFTVCMIILIAALRNTAREFVDCGGCLVPAEISIPESKSE
jgi:hypothetical protein